LTPLHTLLQASEAAASPAAFFLLISQMKFDRIFSILWAGKALANCIDRRKKGLGAGRNIKGTSGTSD
jgi:hypothetical protein